MRRNQGFEDGLRRRVQRTAGAIDRSGARLRAAREVDLHAVAGDADRNLDLDGTRIDPVLFISLAVLGFFSMIFENSVGSPKASISSETVRGKLISAIYRGSVDFVNRKSGAVSGKSTGLLSRGC